MKSKMSNVFFKNKRLFQKSLTQKRKKWTTLQLTFYQFSFNFQENKPFYVFRSRLDAFHVMVANLEICKFLEVDIFQLGQFAALRDAFELNFDNFLFKICNTIYVHFLEILYFLLKPGPGITKHLVWSQEFRWEQGTTNVHAIRQEKYIYRIVQIQKYRKK